MVVYDEGVDSEDGSGCLSLDQKDYDADGEISQPNEWYFCEDKEDIEPNDVILAHTIIDPEAVMVILTYTDAASRAMVFSCLHGMKTNHAKSIDILSLTEESVIVVLLMFLRRDYECSK